MSNDRKSGVVKFFNLKSDFGFIKIDETGEEIERRQPRELVATGDVRAVFSEGLNAEGDELRAWAFRQVVRIEGDPAKLMDRGLEFTGVDFEIDLVTLKPTIGKGAITPTGGQGQE